MFINHEYIYKILEETKNPSNEQIKEVLNRAKNREGLDYKDIAIMQNKNIIFEAKEKRCGEKKNRIAWIL